MPPPRGWPRGPALALLLGALGGCGARDDVAARAGAQVLTSPHLAEILGGFPLTQVDERLARRVATWWLEYQLVAQRVVAGDSMLDSATVIEVLWPEARALVLARWRAQVFADRLPLDSAALDSVFREGDRRLIQHLLLRGSDDPEITAQARARAAALRSRLAQGRSWEAVQRDNEDRDARQRGGSIGVITRGQTVPPFEDAAFALEPGGISPVVESPFGFHVIRRPPLGEVRDEFRAAVEPLIAEHLDSVHVEDLARQWHLVLRPDGLERAGQAVRDPLRFKGSSTVIATFDEGRFTLGDLVRWLRAVPDWMHTQVERGTARELAGFLRMMMGYELLYHEALNNGIWISPSEFAELKQELARRLDQVKVAVGVYPPAPGDSTSVAERERRAAERIDRFLETLRENWGRFARVPPLLTERLQDQWGGTVYPRGVARALGHALAQRPRGDSTDAATR